MVRFAYNTLEFLWRVTKSNDMLLCQVLKTIDRAIGAPAYIKIMAYTYICSGCSDWDLTKFFCDIRKLSLEDLEELTDAYTLYTWTKDVIDTCLQKKLSLKRIAKMIVIYSRKSFVERGRTFRVDLLDSSIIPIREGHMIILKGLPEMPDD